MNTLITTALVGTARHPDAQLATGHDVDALLPPHLSIDREERLLLLAGVQGLYSQAGQQAKSGVPLPEPAAAPTQMVLRSSRLIGLLHQVMNGMKYDLKLLMEFLDTLHHEKVHLPYQVLPLALNVTDPLVRQHLLPVLGERGRWLSQWNPYWAWANRGVDAIAVQDHVALQRAWDEGKLAQRALALSVIRRADAEEGRRWLEETLSQEKADTRAVLVEQLQYGLGPNDEALLERLLDDRSDQVKQLAASLLKQLPDSAFVCRMQQRAQGMLQYQSSQLSAQPPEELPKEWIRDGISPKVPTGRGKRAYYLEQVISAVPLPFWTNHFNKMPAHLLAALKDDDFAEDVILGWTRAIELYTDDNAGRLAWVHALWGYWLTRWQQDKKKGQFILSRIVVLLKLLPSSTAEQQLLPFLVMGRLDVDALTLLLDVLPQPWSQPFAVHYLKLARQVVKTGVIDQSYEWGKTLETAARALPRSAFSSALLPWDLERIGEKSWTATALAQQVERFCEVVRLRKMFFEELTQHQGKDR